MNSSRREKRLYLLDLSRGLAAFVILFWHYQHFFFSKAESGPQFSGLDVQPAYDVFSVFYRFGYSSVQYFWILSGFVLTSAYFQKSVSFKTFFNHRFSRIYPLHFVTLIAVAALQWLSLEQLDHWQIYSNNDLYHFVLNLFFISEWGFQTSYSFNAPIWSVSLEILIYFVFYFSLPLILRFKFWVPIVAMLLFLALLAMNTPGEFWWCGFYFFLGSTCYFIWSALAKRSVFLFSCSLAMLGASLLLLFNSENTGQLAAADYFSFYIGLGLFFSSIVLLLAGLEPYVSEKWARFCQWCGDISFGTYLWHIPLQIGALIFMQMNDIDQNVAESPLFLAGYLALVAITASLSFRFIEKPLRLYLRTFTSEREL